ncbi:MAG TPA: LptF/LptG family permease [Planctomycetota bacterium]|nr:LptF/LptG family permease [Planctomycetota bacterium]
MILQRYIFRELLASFIFAFLAVLMVCMIGTMFQVFRTFPGLGFTILATALPLATGAMATWVILVASSTSSTLVYARLSAENEITAMRACGIHTVRILAPALLLGLTLVGVAYPLNEIVVPWTRHARRLLFRQSTVEALKTPPAGNQDFFVGSFRLHYTDLRDGLMVNPTITQMKGFQVVMDYYAPSGKILPGTGNEPLKVVMLKPRYWRMTENGKREVFSAENEVTIDIPLEDYENGGPQTVDLPARSLWDLYFSSKDRVERNQALLILHTRYASSMAPLLLILVAVPIGILVKKGSRLAGLGASLPPLLIYFVSYFVFQGLGDKGKIHPVLAAYSPDLFLAVLAALLLGGVSRK